MRKFGIFLVTNVLLAGAVSSVAYKKWEKAAIAGVSLVADAAEHLERAATDKEVQQQDRSTEGESFFGQFLSVTLYVLERLILNEVGQSFLMQWFFSF